ncbi:MAG: hypothetical protein FWF80_03410, partial [Defluviitaleaceae bacterium]|nr:hypothetical protein [Defluviitaleaceae bacterium]
FDSGDMLRYISNTLDFTQRTFALLLTGALAAGALIYITSVLYVLKLRTYDIGVFRTLGCSRFYTAALLSLEFAIISLLAFVVAGLAYIATFGTIATAVFDFQYRFNPASWFHSPQEERATAGVYDFINWQRIIEGTQDFVFAPEAGLLQLLVGLLAVMLFTVIIGIIASLFIVRNEPMKTMKEF